MKDIFLELLQPCCGFSFLELRRWVNALKFNDESTRQEILKEIRSNGTLSLDGWRILTGGVSYNENLDSEYMSEIMGGCSFPTCAQWQLIINGMEFNLLNFHVQFGSFYDYENNIIPNPETSEELKYILENFYYSTPEGKWQKSDITDVYIEEFKTDGVIVTCFLYGNVNYGTLFLQNFKIYDDAGTINGAGIPQIGGFVNVGSLEVTAGNIIHSKKIAESNSSTIYSIIFKNLFIDDLDLNLPNLRYLDLSNNSFTNFTQVTELPNLRTLILSDNQIENFYTVLDLSKLEELNLNDNNLMSLEVDYPSGLNNLRRLSLLGAGMTSFEVNNTTPNLLFLEFGGAFTAFNPVYEFPKLTELRIYQAMSLFYFNPSYSFPNLETIKLNITNVRNFNPDNLSFKNLKVLDLSYGELTAIGLTKPLPKIRYLNFSHNKITNWDNTLYVEDAKKYGTINASDNTMKIDNEPLYNKLIIEKKWKLE